MRTSENHMFHRVLAFALTLCLLFQMCPPTAARAAEFDSWDDEVITGEAADNAVIGGELSANGQEPQLLADTVYYVSFEDYVGGQFTSRVVKLENPESVRVVDLIGAAVGGWDGTTKPAIPDLVPDLDPLMEAYPNVMTNTPNTTQDLYSDVYLTALTIDGKEIANAGGVQWFVTVNGNYGSVDYTKYSKATNQYNTAASGSVIRVMLTGDNGYALGITDWVNGDELFPRKDDLVVRMGDNIGHPNYDQAEAILINADALRSDVEVALKLFTSLEEQAAPVIALIEALPAADAVQESDRDAVKNARDAYNKLSKDVQAKVTNYQKLLDAEAALEAALPRMNYYVSLEDHTGTFTSKVMKVEATSKNPTDVIAAAVGGSGNVEIWQGDMMSYPVALTVDGRKVANTNGASQEGSYWIVSVEGLNKYDEGVKKSGFMPWFYDKLVKGTGDDQLADEAVIRLIYTDNAENAVTTVTNMFSATFGRKVLSPDKTQLVKDLTDKPGDPSWDAAFSVLLNPRATADEVANAFAGGSEPETNPDQEKADAVIAQIAALAPVSLEKKEAVAAARAAFNALTAEQQALVTNKADLESAEAGIRRLEKEAADKAAAQAVVDQIAALPEADALTMEDAAAVQAARDAFDGLSVAQQAFVTNYNKLDTLEKKLEELNKPVEPAFPNYYVSFEDYTGGAFESSIVPVYIDSKRTVDIIGAALGNADGTSDLPGSQDNAWANDIMGYPNNIKLIHPMGDFGVEGTYYVAGLKIGETWVENSGSRMWIISVDNDYSAYKFQNNQNAEKAIIRCLYSADKGRDVGAADYLNSKTVNLPANKDVIVSTLGQNPQHQMADQAWGVLLNGKASQADVENAFTPRDPAADQAAADKVIDLIKAIPEVITTEDEAPILAAREAYEQLDAAQKKLVTNYETLQNAEKAYNKAHAQPVIDLIAALPERIEKSDEEQVKAARRAYDRLDERYQPAVENYAKLQQAEKDVKQRYADEVIAMIDALPAPEDVSIRNMMDVLDAKAAYDDLKGSHQRLVTNLDKLEKCMARVDAIMAQPVIDQINALPSAEEAAVEDNAKIVEARNAYNNLSYDQKKLVKAANYAKLEAIEAKINPLAAGRVLDMINALPTYGNVVVSRHKDQILATRAAYDALSYDQQQLAGGSGKIDAAMEWLAAAEEDLKIAQPVIDQINALENVTLADEQKVIDARNAYEGLAEKPRKQVDAAVVAKLTAAEAKIEELKNAGTADQAEADKVVKLINELGEITLQSEEKILAARAALEKLTPAQKSLVTNQQVLIDAEAKLQELKKADQAAAQKVIDLINALPEPEKVTLENKEAVAAARNAFEKLTQDQVRLVDALLQSKLDEAEKKIAELEKPADPEADKKAADAVTEQINALPAEITIDHRQAVAAARAALNKLTPEQKALVPAEVQQKLADAEKKISEQEELLGKYTYYVTLEDYTGKTFESRIVTVHTDSRRMNEIIATALGEWEYNASLDPRLNMPTPNNLKNGTDPKGSTATYPVGALIDGQWVENEHGNSQKGKFWVVSYNSQYDANQYFHRSKKADVEEGSVIRMMYTPDGGFILGAGDVYTPQPDNGMGALRVKKDQLIRDMATRELTEEEYAKARAVWLNPAAKQNDVDFTLFTPTYYISLEDYTGTAFENRLIQFSYPSWKVMEVVSAALGAPEGEKYYKEWVSWNLGEHHYISGLFIDGKWVENANGSEPKGNFWVTSVNNKSNPYYSRIDMSDGAVIRLMYTPDGGKTLGIEDILWQEYLTPNKDALVKRLIQEPDHRMAGYVRSVLMNPKADQTTVDNAFDKEAVPATGLTLDKTGVQVLQPNQSVTVRATVEPQDVTETLHWTLQCNRKGFTLKDNGDGSATVTAKEIPDTFTLTAEISGIEKTVMGYVPTTPYGNAAIEPAEGDVVLGNAILSVEKHALGGENAYLVAPVSLPVIDQKSYTPAMMLQAAFGDYTMLMNRAEAGLQDSTVGAMKDPSVTKLTGSMKEFGFLSNGDYGENSAWIMTINNKRVLNPTQLAYARLKDGDVVRFLYTVDGGADIGLAGDKLSVNKDQLMALVVEAEQDLNGFFQGQPGPQNPRFVAYQAAKAAMGDIGATQAAVNDAAAKMDSYLHGTELNPAESIKLDKQEITIAKGTTTTLKVEVLPKNTTDSVEWTIDNPAVVGFTDEYPELDKQGTATRTIQALGDGTATITVKAGGRTASCTVTVRLIPATQLKITTADTQLMMKKQLTMQADFGPADTTDQLVWSVDHPEIARIDAKTGRVTPVALGKVTITAALGTLTDTHELEIIPYDGPFVYFEYQDGRSNQPVSDDGTITLSPLDIGRFKVGKLDKGHEVDWDCTAEIRDPDDLYSQHYFISADGTFVPYALGSYTARVTDKTTGKAIQNFTLKIVSSGISELKTFIGDQEVNTAEAFVGSGSQRYWVTVKGFQNGKWITVPTQALAFTGSDDNGHIKHDGSFKINANGTAVFTVVLLENFDITASFTATSHNVPVTAFHVNVPEKFVMDSWNGIFFDDFNGLQPYTGYTWSVEPANASNKGLAWEALTPDIAEYVYMHNAGIVPKKAGIAKFRVWASGNRDLPPQEVQIEMVYKDPLTSVTPRQDVIEMKEFTTAGLGFDFQPGNATEKRMHWTMEPEGIIQIKTSVTNDPNDVSVPKMTAFSIVAKKPGTVKVTGTPYDLTGGALPVTFTVKVTKDENMEVIDYLADAKAAVANGLIALENKHAHQLELNSEWTIFSTLRAGGRIEQSELDSYYQSVLDAGAKLTKKRATDIARVVLALGVMGKDPTNVGGIDLLAELCENVWLNKGDTSNAYVFALIALDSVDYKVPEGATWTREKLIEKILSYQTADGGFGLGDNQSNSLDMTGMSMQALAPYYGTNPAVKEAFDKGIQYISTQIAPNGSLSAEGGENGCTVAQAVTALCAAGMDPTKIEGLTFGNQNMITFLTSLQAEGGGFSIYPGAEENIFGSEQITYGLEAYIRFAEGKNRLYDLTDVMGGTDPDVPADPEADKAAAKAVTELIEALPEAARVTRDDKTAIEAARAAFDKLTEAQKALVTNTDKLIAAEKALAELDQGDRKPIGTVTFTVERFTIGQGFFVEPVQVPIYEGDLYTDVIVRVLGDAAMLRSKGNYLEAITGADMGPDHVNIPAYLTEMSGGTVTTESVRKYYNDMLEMDILPFDQGTLGEFVYSQDSGWMYAVNGVFPNVGIGSRNPVDGDVCRLQYTVFGLGRDVSDPVVTNKDVLVKAMGAVNAESPVIRNEAGLKEAYAKAVEVMSDMTSQEVQATADALLKALENAKSNAPGLVQDAINNLPAADKVTEAHRGAIEAARKAYDSLTAEQKKNVDASRLEAAEKALTNLAVTEVEKLIDALPEKITLKDKAAVEAARKACEGLTAEQKKLVRNLKKLTDAEQAIKDLENVPETVPSITDPASKVTLTADGLTSDMELIVSLLGKDDEAVKAMRREIPSTEGLIRIYDVKLVRKANAALRAAAQEIELTGKAALRLPVDKKYDGQTLKVLFVGSNGKVQEMKGKVEDGAMTLEVTELGAFGLVVNSQKPGGNGGNGGNGGGGKGPAKTGDETPIALLMGTSVLSLAALAAIAVMLDKKRRQRN